MSYILLEYLCGVCGERFESLEDRGNPSKFQYHCNSKAPRVLSAPRVKAPLVTVERAGREDRAASGVASTRPLAEGMSTSAWKAARRQERIIARRRSNRADL